MRRGWSALLVLSGAVAGCGGRGDSGHDRRGRDGDERPFTADDFPEDEEEDGPAGPTRGESVAAQPQLPAVSAPGSPTERACGADGVVRRSVSVFDQTQLDTLDGCERIAGNFSLNLFEDIDEAPLLALQTVEGGLTVRGTAEAGHALNGFRSLEHVGRLFLDGVTLRDLQPLRQLRTIGGPSRTQDFELPENQAERGLEIANCSGLTSLYGLDALESVTRIHLNGNRDLVSLAGLVNVQPVDELSSLDCPLLDLQGLEQLSVVDLVLFGTALTSLEGLGNAPRLQRLTLSENPALRSLEGGVFPPRMADLAIAGADALPNLQGLEGLREVDSLNLTAGERGRSSLSSLAGLERLEQVGFLNLSGLSSLPSLAGLDALLSVGQFQITSSAFVDLAGMPSLQQIDQFYLLDAPGLTSLQGLGSTRISSLSMHDVSLTSLAGLEQVSLGSLEIAAAPQLASLQGLPPLTTLAGLFITDTPALVDARALAGLSAIENLMLQNTRLAHLDALGDLRQLRGLYVYDNPELVQIDGLGAVAGLSELEIRNNDALQSWPGAAFLQQAGYVTVSNNQALTALPGFSRLRSVAMLSIEDNPSLADLDLSNLESAYMLLIRGNAALDDVPLEPVRQRLSASAQVKIVSNLSGPARLSPCPWQADGVCDEERADCAAGSDPDDCRYSR